MTAEETTTSNQDICILLDRERINHSLRGDYGSEKAELLGCGPLLDAIVTIHSCSPFIALAPKSSQKFKNMPLHHLDRSSALRFPPCE